jgi:hypothetical protein
MTINLLDFILNGLALLWGQQILSIKRIVQ